MTEKSEISIARCPICGNEADAPRQISYHFNVRCKTSLCLAAPAHRTKAEAIAVWNAIALAFSQRQHFYTKLYDTYMDQSAWEWCDELRAEYPELERVRSPDGSFDTVIPAQTETDTTAAAERRADVFPADG